MTFNALDFIIIGVITFSSLISLYRGFFSELFSLMTWAVAIWLPFNYTEQFAVLLPAAVESPSARWFASCFTLFIGAMVVGSILSFMIRKILTATGGGCANRLLGLAIGAVRGVLIVAVLALLGTSNPSIPSEKLWQNSKLMPLVLKISRVIQSQLPDNLSEWFRTKNKL